MIRTMLRRVTGRRWPKVQPGELLSCPEVGRLLQSYLDGELGEPTEVEALTVHLEECRRCGLEADTYLRIKSALERRGTDVPEESVRRLREFGERLVQDG